MNNRKKGITTWEVTLFILFLTISLGSSLFFFFINSTNVQKANNKHEWIEEINQILDEVCLEIANSITISEPRVTSSDGCYFRQAMDGLTLETAVSEEGFYFINNNLYYGNRGNIQKKFNGRNSPLIVNCTDGRFTPISLNQIELEFKASSPNKDEPQKTFTRRINLRNK